jgi:hypothetical protein
MARIRAIKPELRTSLTVSAWPMPVRYFFVLLWGYLDDHGRGVDDGLLIAADCFPRDRGIQAEDVDTWLDLMADSGSVCRYDVDGRRFLHCPNWTEHQRPQHPAKPKIPPCPHDEPGEFAEWRTKNPERPQKPSRNPPEAFTKIDTALSGTSPAPSGNPSEDHGHGAGATIFQLPTATPTPTPQRDNSAGHGAYGEPRETLTKVSGEVPEILTPDQGAGSREQGAGKNPRPNHAVATRTPEPLRPDVEEACTLLADLIEANGSKRPRITQAWRDAARRAIDIDGRTPEQLCNAIRWCQADDFWRGNVLSMPKLREKYDQLRLAAGRQPSQQRPAYSTTDDRVAGWLALKSDHEEYPA